MHPLTLILCLVFVPFAICNTEIINFSTQEAVSFNLPFTHSWPVLRSDFVNLQWNASLADSPLLPDICTSLQQWSPENLRPCPGELWVTLDLDGAKWQHFDKFTLRLSWPAFYPSDYSITIFEPNSFASFADLSSGQVYRTRTKYARIQAIYTGVRTPSESDDFERISYHQVPILLTLEPLYFGVLPQSVIPIVCAILAVIVLGYPAANKLNTVLQNFVEDARANALSIAKTD